MVVDDAVIVDYTIPSNASDAQTSPPDLDALEIAHESTAVSPDGSWQATAIRTVPVHTGGEERIFTSLTVTDGETVWTTIAEWRRHGLGFLQPDVYQWSQDGRYLYYANMVAPDGCFVFSGGTDLYRFDTVTGDIVEILPAAKTQNPSFSPDESALAYTTYNGQQEVFVLRDVGSEDEKSVPLTENGEAVQAGEILWSADGQTVVFTLVSDACSDTKSSSIVRVNTGTMMARTLIDKDDRAFLVHDWADSGQPVIRLIDEEGNLWRLNINTGNLAQDS